jgi:hypothetical protein
MARISRVVASGYPHHVTQRGVRSIPIFDDDADREKSVGMPGKKTGRVLMQRKAGRPVKRAS